LAGALALALTLGVVVLVVNHSRSVAAPARDQPDEPLSDERAAAQVVDAVLEVVKSTAVRDPAGGYAFISCKNSGDPPYRAAVHLTFTVPRGNSVAYLNGMAAAIYRRHTTERATERFRATFNAPLTFDASVQQIMLLLDRPARCV